MIKVSSSNPQTPANPSGAERSGHAKQKFDFLFICLTQLVPNEHTGQGSRRTMSTISTALRHFKEPTKKQLTEIFFSLPPLGSVESQSNAEDVDKMDINAVLSIADGIEDSYVCDR